MACPMSFLLIVMCVALIFSHPLLSSFARLSFSLFVMLKVDPRNKMGAIVHAVSNRVLSDRTVKNIYGNVNYDKQDVPSGHHHKCV